MHHKSEPDDVNELKKLGYDRRDVQLKPLAWAVVGFFAFTVLSAIVMIPFYKIFVGGPLFAGESPQAIQRRWEEPQPPLQNRETAKTDIVDLRKKEHEALTTSGPSLEEPGKYRIPIDQAIDEIAERGLPQPAAPKAPEVAPQ
ncbi:MAG: hypothetical protein M9921_05100 [Fimbriimonadaceae bacterium]|nr:hypothetical protein [Fimbriimonadaceae bacterium]